MKIISNCWPTVTKPAVPISCKLTTTFTYGEFKGYWFGSYRWFHHCDFKQRCKQQKLLLLSQETLRRKITSLKWWAENSQQFRNLKKSCIVCRSFLYVCREGKSRNKTMRKDQIWSQCWKQNKKYVYIYIFFKYSQLSQYNWYSPLGEGGSPRHPQSQPLVPQHSPPLTHQVH